MPVSSEGCVCVQKQRLASENQSEPCLKRTHTCCTRSEYIDPDIPLMFLFLPDISQEGWHSRHAGLVVSWAHQL